MGLFVGIARTQGYDFLRGTIFSGVRFSQMPFFGRGTGTTPRVRNPTNISNPLHTVAKGKNTKLQQYW